MYISDLIVVCIGLTITVSLPSVDCGIFNFQCWEGTCNFSNCHKHNNVANCPFPVQTCIKDMYMSEQRVIGRCAQVFVKCQNGNWGRYTRTCCSQKWQCNKPGDLRHLVKKGKSLSSLNTASQYFVLFNFATFASRPWKN